MKPVEEMNAMEVCAYMVAKSSKKLVGQDEIRRLYDIHCAKLKKELMETGRAEKVSAEFLKELQEAVNAEADGSGEKPVAPSV